MRSLSIKRISTAFAAFLLINPMQSLLCKTIGSQAEYIRKPLQAATLARLADIGPTELSPGRHFMAVSPDHRKVAFQVRQADPVTNRYQLKMVVVGIGDNAPPTVIDEGGDLILLRVPGLNGAIVDTGLPATIEPQWSPDGQYVYFLKQVGGTLRIWRASATGRDSVPVTRGSQSIDGFALSSDGRKLRYSATVPDQALLARLKEEALTGYRYDGRFVPLVDTMPSAVIKTRMEHYEVDLITGNDRLQDRLGQNFLEHGSDSALHAVSQDGRAVWSRDSVSSSNGRAVLEVQETDRVSRLCKTAACSDVNALWWTPDGRRVQFMRREGWAASETAVYEWNPRRNNPVRLYSSPDLLIDCQSVNKRLLCAREQSKVPRQVILLDPTTGHSDIVFDPNPTFAQFAIGKTERLNWRNAFGLESFGDLVYPVGFEPGKRYPLIVVQYVSRGFLRGGVGDEFPIQVFANRGYAVLSIQRPDFQIPDEYSGDRISRERWRLQDFRDRRSVLSSIEVAVETLIRRGIADPKRIGITGLSDGSSTVQFAALNSKLFKAGSVSGCCWDPFQDAFFGPTTAEMYHRIGWPTLADNRAEFWSHISLIEGGPRIAFPILMQQADSELRGAVASFTAIGQARKTAALYVFPNEYHVKWQPVHRLAVYERNVRWFDFWLRGIGDPKEWNP